MNTFKNQIKSNFTAIPNNVAEDESLSWKAKGIFLYLASKPDNWNFYMDEIKTNATDGKVALQSGIKELEDKGYLKRTRIYKDSKIIGWNWELTLPEWDDTLQSGNLSRRKVSQKEGRLYNKKDNNKKDNSNTNKTLSETGEQDKFIPLAKHLSKTVQTKMNIVHSKKQIDSWANEIRKLSEKNKIDRKRIIKALKWYRQNIGGQYVPVIESGSAFREKFIKLENAMKRAHNPVQHTNGRPVNGYMEDAYKWKDHDMIV